MQNILENTPAANRPGTPWLLLLILCGFVLVGLFLFTFLAQALVLPVFGLSVEEMLSLLSGTETFPGGRTALMTLQGVTSLGAFVLAPGLFIATMLKLNVRQVVTLPPSATQPVFMTIVIMFCFMVANSVVIEWNQNLDLPSAFDWFESWAQGKEAQLRQLTEYLTAFAGITELLIGLVVIAIIPAVGEELLFRGLIQNLFHATFKNAHIAIWVSAFIFGAFHMQFYGVVPRMLLGALFGYLYFWSGHLSLAMIAHFINNAFTLVMIYLSQQEVIDFNPAEVEQAPPFHIILIFFIVGSLLLFLFRKYFEAKGNA